MAALVHVSPRSILLETQKTTKKHFSTPVAHYDSEGKGCQETEVANSGELARSCRERADKKQQPNKKIKPKSTKSNR
jgi:hypothetical protein